MKEISRAKSDGAKYRIMDRARMMEDSATAATDLCRMQRFKLHLVWYLLLNTVRKKSIMVPA